MSSQEHEQVRIPGRDILREIIEAYQPYRQTIADRHSRVLIVRFEATAAGSETWAMRMRASAISAEQKVRVFTALGAQAEEVVFPDTVSTAEFVDRIEAANADSDAAALIVQFPPPARLVGELDRIQPGKDIDCLSVNSPRIACATADGISRVVEPFLRQGEVAVVGSRGFVGSGVVAILREGGHPPLELDAGDDLRQLREVDIVISTAGRAGLLTAEHLHSGHRLVVDSGFVPSPAGPVGDVHPSARHLPQAITPVPGGIGPIEMATLAERLTVQLAAPDLSSWRYHGPAGTVEAGAFTSAHHDVQHQLAAASQQHEQQARTARIEAPPQAEPLGPSPPEGDDPRARLRRQEEEAGLSYQEEQAWRHDAELDDSMRGPVI